MHIKIYLGAIILFIIDFVSKRIIASSLVLGESIKIIPSFFDIEYHINTGGAFSLFSGYSFVLALIAIGTIFYIHSFLKNVKKTREMIGFSLLIGGIFGNLVDRILYGHVIDFLAFNFFGYSFPVFNIADIGICLGVFLIVIANIDANFGGKNENSSK